MHRKLFLDLVKVKDDRGNIMGYKKGLKMPKYSTVILTNPFNGDLTASFGTEKNFLPGTCIYKDFGRNKRKIARKTNMEARKMAKKFGVRYEPIVHGAR